MTSIRYSTGFKNISIKCDTSSIIKNKEISSCRKLRCQFLSLWHDVKIMQPIFYHRQRHPPSLRLERPKSNLYSQFLMWTGFCTEIVGMEICHLENAPTLLRNFNFWVSHSREFSNQIQHMNQISTLQIT